MWIESRSRCCGQEVKVAVESRLVTAAWCVMLLVSLPGQCRFTLFLSKVLQPGWRLKSASVRRLGSGSLDSWSYVVDQPPSGSSETATFSLMTTRSNVKVGVSQVLVLERLVFAGPSGKTWQDAFRP